MSQEVRWVDGGPAAERLWGANPTSRPNPLGSDVRREAGGSIRLATSGLKGLGKSGARRPPNNLGVGHNNRYLKSELPPD